MVALAIAAGATALYVFLCLLAWSLIRIASLDDERNGRYE